MLDTSRILQKGPEYLRKQMEREREAPGRSAAERLAATKPEYIRNQQPPASETSEMSETGSSMCSSDQSEETPTPSSPANNDEDVDESSPHEVNVVKRNSSKKRPDSLLLYRQKGELQRGASDGYGKKPNKRTLLLSRRDKTIPFSRQQLDESEYEASSGQRLANETNQGCEDVARKPATVVTNIQEDVARKPTTVVTTNREDVPRKPTTVVTNIPENISRKPTTVVTNIPEDVSRKPTTVVTNNREDVARKLTTAAASDHEDAARKLTTVVTNIPEDVSKKPTTVVMNIPEDVSRKPTTVVTNNREDVARKLTTAAASDREDAARKLTTVVTNNHMDVARKPAITVLTNIPEDVSRKPTTVVTNNREDVAAATTTNREDTAKKVTTVVRSNRVDATRKPIKVLKNNREDVSVARKPMTVVTNNREDVANRSDVDDVTSSSERRRNRVSRSHSDISSRYSRSFAADFDTFFTYCGLDDDVVESVGRENFCTCSESVEEVFTGSGKVRSVSMAISDDGFSQTGSVHSDGLLEDELPDKKSGQGTSVIERNARIIKWLYSCRNAAQSGKTLRDLV